MRTSGRRTSFGLVIAAYAVSACLGAHAQQASQAGHVASRDMVEHYDGADRLIGSQVLNLDGERIGEVKNLILSATGDVKEVVVQLFDHLDADEGPIAVSPHRLEVVSADGPHVVVLRIDLTCEEVVHAQLLRLKSNARAPAEREAGLSDMHRDTGPVY